MLPRAYPGAAFPRKPPIAWTERRDAVVMRWQLRLRQERSELEKELEQARSTRSESGGSGSAQPCVTFRQGVDGTGHGAEALLALSGMPVTQMRGGADEDSVRWRSTRSRE